MKITDKRTIDKLAYIAEAANFMADLKRTCRHTDRRNLGNGCWRCNTCGTRGAYALLPALARRQAN